jgi:hypothetical protein
VVVCRNCHRKLSDDQRDHPDPSTPDPPWSDQLAHWLLGVADFLIALAERMRDWARVLLDLGAPGLVSHPPAGGAA